MNIDPIFPNSTQAPNIVSKAKSIDLTDHFPKEISKRLDALQLLSEAILTSSNSKFTPVIKALNESCIDYKRSKLLFIEAYVQDFNEEERDYFLSRFLEHFDPEKEVIQLQSMSFESKDSIWENIIRYVCDSYMGFPASSPSLTKIFSSPLSEEDLESRFDKGMDLLLDFAKEQACPTEIKVLFSTYLARLITQLEEFESGPMSPDSSSFKALFDELYYYLLNLPFPSTNKSFTLISLMKEDLKLIDKVSLSESFTQKLLSFFKNQSIEEGKLKTLKEVFEQIDFLDLKES